MIKQVKLFLAFFLGNLLWMSAPVVAQQIIAHRGASYLAPENTLASVKLGYELGADAVEIDVHLSKDKRIMVIHDDNTKRTTKGRNYFIKDTDASKLRKVDAGRRKDRKYKGEKIPFLQEVLDLVPIGKTLVIEVKSGPETLPYLKKIIEKSEIQDRLVLISFNKDVVIQGKEMMPSIPAFWLLHTFSKYTVEEAIQIAKENNLAGLDVYYKVVNQDFMQQMHNAGLEVYAYTIDDPEKAKELKSLQIDGITTNRPQWLREHLLN